MEGIRHKRGQEYPDVQNEGGEAQKQGGIMVKWALTKMSVCERARTRTIYVCSPNLGKSMIHQSDSSTVKGESEK